MLAGDWWWQAKIKIFIVYNFGSVLSPAVRPDSKLDSNLAD